MRVERGAGQLLELVSDGSQPLGAPVVVLGDPFAHEFELPAAARWVRAGLSTPDLAPERAAICDGLVGEQTTLCRNRLAITGITSAIYQRP